MGVISCECRKGGPGCGHRSDAHAWMSHHHLHTTGTIYFITDSRMETKYSSTHYGRMALLSVTAQRPSCLRCASHVSAGAASRAFLKHHALGCVGTDLGV
eukprot:1161302-Pelagomonas_calceolata.AAC.6